MKYKTLDDYPVLDKSGAAFRDLLNGDITKENYRDIKRAVVSSYYRELVGEL